MRRVFRSFWSTASDTVSFIACLIAPATSATNHSISLSVHEPPTIRAWTSVDWETVKRPARVKVRALDRDGKPFEIEGQEFLSRAICHEIDHLDGVLFIDRLPAIRRDIVKRRIKKMVREGEWDGYYEKKARKRSQPGPATE